MRACRETLHLAPTPKAAPSKNEIELTSEALFEGERTLSILHKGERYQLRITRANKLILTK